MCVTPSVVCYLVWPRWYNLVPFFLCVGKIRAWLWARQLMLCLGKTVWLGQLRTWTGVAVEGCKPLWMHWSSSAPKLGVVLSSGRTARSSSMEAESCKHHGIIYAVFRLYASEEHPRKWFLCHRVLTFLLWSLKALLVLLVHPYLGYFWAKYQYQIHVSSFLHLSCPNSIFLLIRVLFEGKHYPVVLVTQLVNLVKKWSPVLIGIYTSRSKLQASGSIGLEWGIQGLHRQLPLAAGPGAQAKTAVSFISLACNPLLLTGTSL